LEVRNISNRIEERQTAHAFSTHCPVVLFFGNDEE
jgi:hypothetical protein